MSSRWIPLGSIALYLGFLIVVGLWARRRTAGFREYVTGGGIPAWMLALSFMANFISSNSFVGHSAKSYQVGLSWCVVGAIMVACCFVSWHVFAPRFASFAREHGAETLPDYFEKRFRSRAAGQVSHWLVVASTLFYALAVLRGTGLVLSSGLQISYPQALLVLYGVTVAYCLLGGLWADVTTDVVQAGVLTAGAVALMAAVATATHPSTPVAAPEIRSAAPGLLLAVGLSGGVKLLADPKQVMVFYAFQDAQAARRFRWAGPVLLLVVYACLFPLGYLARGLVPAPADLDSLVPSLVFEHGVLPTWFGAMFLVALLGASMSSIDSAFLVLASCVEKHVVAPLTSSAPSVGRTRALLFGIATLVLGLSFRPLAGIVELTTIAGALTAATLPAICVGFTSREVPASRVILSMLAGTAGVVAGKLGPGLLGLRSPWIQDVFVGLLASTLVLLPAIASSRRKAPDDLLDRRAGGI